MVKINSKKEINRGFIARALFCFLLAFGALSIIYVASKVTGSEILSTRRYIIVMLCVIPFSILYALFVDRIGSGLANTLLGWTSGKTNLSEQLSADLARARFSKGRGQFREAIIIINEVLEKHPDFPEARLLKAQIVWEGLGNKELALRNLDRVMELVEDSDPIHRWALNYYHEVKKGRKTDI